METIAANSDGSLPIKIQKPQLVQLGGNFHSGCAIIDVSFPNIFYVEVKEIHIKNYYTATVSVQGKFREQGTSDGDLKWKTCVDNFVMMPNCHHDTGAEDVFVISSKQMQCDLSNIVGMRLILRQPSPMWKEFKLDEIVCYKQEVSVQPSTALPNWMDEGSDKPRADVKDVCDFLRVSSHLQQMWAISEKAGSVQSRIPLGRYDVDGSYEINLLSYV